MKTIFEQIIDREIPATIVYEDDYTLAFLDIAPVNIGHTVVIPKKHFKNLYEIDTETLHHIADTVQKVAIAIKKALNADGINIEQNNEVELKITVICDNFGTLKAQEIIDLFEGIELRNLKRVLLR